VTGEASARAVVVTKGKHVSRVVKLSLVDYKGVIDSGQRSAKL
jgi:hypothetical protein